jgi:carbon monoxide dehydrogenase subunit G
MDPAVISSCIPGCEELEQEGEDRYRAKLNVALAAITGTYDGTVVISEKNAPASYRLTVEGQGKAGFVKGNAAIAK